MANKRSKGPSLQDNVDQGLVIVIVVGLVAGWLITAVKQNVEIQVLQDRITTHEQTEEHLRDQISTLRVEN